MRHNILILDGVEGTDGNLDAALKAADYVVNRVESTDEAMARCEHTALILLVMPTAPAPFDEFIREWQLDGGAPLLILDAPSDTTDAIRALELGADDFICQDLDWSQPNSDAARELLARVAAALRTRRPLDSVSPTLSFGRLQVSIEAQAAYVASQPLPLTPREFDVLVALIRSPETTPVDQLLESVWGSASLGQHHYAHVYVSRLRKKLKRARAQIEIESRPGFGYQMQLIDPAAEEDESDSEPDGSDAEPDGSDAEPDGSVAEDAD